MIMTAKALLYQKYGHLGFTILDYAYWRRSVLNNLLIPRFFRFFIRRLTFLLTEAER